MDKTYNPTDIEQRWYQRWEQDQQFVPATDGNSDSDPYCIVIPPPNVTGYLHMGHAFQDTIMDLLVRYQRMRGASTLWQVGTDHAGIATQMVVERQLAAEGITRHDLGRENSLKRSGSGKNNPVARSPSSCVGWVLQPTGAANVSPWTAACPPPSAKSL